MSVAILKEEISLLTEPRYLFLIKSSLQSLCPGSSTRRGGGRQPWHSADFSNNQCATAQRTLYVVKAPDSEACAENGRSERIITHHTRAPPPRCFCGERRCFWPRRCSCPCLPSGPFWWWGCGRPWWRSWGQSLGWECLRSSATPPENMSALSAGCVKPLVVDGRWRLWLLRFPCPSAQTGPPHFRCLLVFLPSLHPPPSLLYVSYVAAAVAITPPGTHHVIGLSSSSRHHCFPLRGQPPWCSFLVNCSWHHPSHFPVNSPCAGKLWWGIPPPLISTASDWLANPSLHCY